MKTGRILNNIEVISIHKSFGRVPLFLIASAKPEAQPRRERKHVPLISDEALERIFGAGWERR